MQMKLLNPITSPPSLRFLLTRSASSLVKRINAMEIWQECFGSSIIPSRPYLRVINKGHMRWEKNMAKAILFYRTGSLKFRTSW